MIQRSTSPENNRGQNIEIACTTYCTKVGTQKYWPIAAMKMHNSQISADGECSAMNVVLELARKHWCWANGSWENENSRNSCAISPKYFHKIELFFFVGWCSVWRVSHVCVCCSSPYKLERSAWKWFRNWLNEASCNEHKRRQSDVYTYFTKYEWNRIFCFLFKPSQIFDQTMRFL